MGLTGVTPLPPLFATAYHQCRWNYKDEADVYDVDATFDEQDIPYDVMWLDIEHTDGKKYFTWDPHKFPNPIQMQDSLASRHRMMVTIIDPHLKRDSSWHIHTEATANNYYVKEKDGSKDFEGWCWPGSSSYLDYLNPEVRDYWARQLQTDKYVGSTTNLFHWNDMNEPSVFNGPEVTMQKDLLHFNKTEHRDLHNMYGHLQVMSSFQGFMDRGKGASAAESSRHFTLSRSFFAGTQRYAAIWTGDNMAKWSHLEASVPMLLTCGLAGMTFSGADVGGFFFNPDTELLVRWYQVGAFYPFFRAHAHIETKRREPWLFGEPHTSNIRRAVRMRYKLLPFFYTLFMEAHLSGTPVMRPLWVEYPDDPETFGMDDQFLVGSDILVKPATQIGQTSTELYLPGSEPWYEIQSAATHAGGQRLTLDTPIEKIAVLQRGGSIVPRKERARRASAAMARDPYTLMIALDSSGKASGELYIDDGNSLGYTEGQYIWRTFSWADNKLSSSAKPGLGAGFETDVKVERVVVMGVRAAPKGAKVMDGGAPRELSFDYNPAASMLVVRKPLTAIAKDWVIELSY